LILDKMEEFAAVLRQDNPVAHSFVTLPQLAFLVQNARLPGTLE